MSLVICFLREIKQELDTVTDKIITETGKNVLIRIKSELTTRFTIDDVHLAASLLDPALKNVDWMDDYMQKDESGSLLQTRTELLKYFIDLFDIKVSTSKEQIISEQKKNNDIINRRLKLLSNIGIKPIEKQNEADSMIDEINNYFKERLDDIPSSIYQWWDSKNTKFPNLAELFIVFLSIPPTSSSSEVAFSKAGKFLRPDRSMLSSTKVKKMCFINENIRFLEMNEDVFIINN